MNIEDYGLIGDTHTVALVGRNGSIDWLCLPRFDSGACFASLLGTEENGCWKISPSEEVTTSKRAYKKGTLVLDTEFETKEGCVRVTDCMPLRDGKASVVRMVTGVRGRVKMKMLLIVRFDYGSVVPWTRRVDGHLEAVAGPNALSFWSDAETSGEGFTTVAEFDVNEGDNVAFELVWHPSHEKGENRGNVASLIEETADWWRDWSSHSLSHGEWGDVIERSLITLKALTYAPTGGIVAAATTSLPEQLGSVRNWDYRYCWLRDSTFTLYALINGGHNDEAGAWSDWLLRAVAGDPSKLQIMYGAAGERRLDEYEVPWLAGYENSKPVRIGNAAHSQFQLDVYGEVIASLHHARRTGIEFQPHAWNVQRAIMEFLETAWMEPDEGIWEVRGPRRHFTHSKLMAWVAFDRAIKAVEDYGCEGPAERWKEHRDRLFHEICERGYNKEKAAFVQEYDGDQLDASLLMLPLAGFLPPEDERVRGTVAAIEKELLADGFVLRYRSSECSDVDGLPPGEGAFLLCTFWLADVYVMMGRKKEAREIFERVLAVRNDLGLLAEQYDPRAKRLLGNFPQAFSHVGLANTARNLTQKNCPASEQMGAK